MDEHRHVVSRVRPVLRLPPLSLRLWDLDWGTLLPWAFEDVAVESATFDDAFPFIRDNYGRIFGKEADQGRFLGSPMTEAKRRFCGEADVFLFRDAGKIVGVFMGHPSDWSTYYMRTAALLPEYAGRKLVSRFMDRICEPLRAAGVERLEGDVSPTNTPMMKLHLGQGFLVTSMVNSERWGTYVRFTRHLSGEADAVYRRQFCSTPPFRDGQPTTQERRTS